MPQESALTSLVFVYGTLICLVFVASIFLFMIHYQNRMLRHQQELRQKDEERERQVLQSLIEGHEKEQERIGRELHDSIGMEVVTLKLDLYNIRKDLEARGLNTASVEKARADLDLLYNNVRSLSHTMLPYTIQKNGLAASLQKIVDGINQEGSVKAGLHHQFEPTAVTDEKQLAVFRIAQELLQNVLKHAKATEVYISLTQNNNLLMLEIRDNGCGFNTQKPEVWQGVGLQNISSRVRLLGGQFNIQSVENKGTIATLTL